MPSDRDRVVAVPPGGASVRELVRRRMGVESDPWNLALVQRAEKWDQVRMRHLLDSLLASYPIGSLLLCRVREQSRVIHSSDGVRVVEDADPDMWQLLDGQQRVNALYSMLTAEGRYGQFYLHMAMEREPPGPVQNRKSKDRALRYIAWLPDHGNDLDERHLHVELSRWFVWAEGKGEEELRGLVSSPDPCLALRELDPKFATSLTAEEARIAAERFRCLVNAWLEPSVPLLRATVQSPLDVLEVFTRINLAGVAVVGADVYFAAVKTFWSDAETCLERVASATPSGLGRMDALRLVSRLASRGLGQGDILPLSVDRLAGRNGEPLIAAMQKLTAEDSPVMDRIQAFSSWYVQNSCLGYGLKRVRGELWDDVLGWAATSDCTDEAWYLENRQQIDGYLLGATLFRYRSVMGDRFHRSAFLEAMTAGSNSWPFPTDQILAVMRSGSGLTGNRRAVRGLTGENDRQWTADHNGELLTSLAQRIPYDAVGIDWDHIFPTGQARRMWARGDGRRRHHPDRRLINSAGNLWAMNASVNRSLQDKPPIEKFEQLITWQEDETAGYVVWPTDRWSLTPEEVAQFCDVDRLLTDDEGSINDSMKIFRDLVTARTQRLLDEALARFPDVRLFANDPGQPAGDATPAGKFSEALRITLLSPPPAEPRTKPALEGGELDFGPAWVGRSEELKWVVKEVTRLLKNEGDRAEWSGRRSQFDFARWVRTGSEGEGTYLAVGLSNTFTTDPASPFWLQINDQDTNDFDVAVARISDSLLAKDSHKTYDPSAAGRTRLWVPLEAPHNLAKEMLAAHILAQAQQVCDVILRGDMGTKLVNEAQAEEP